MEAIVNPPVDGQPFFEQMRDCRAPYRILAQCIGEVCSPFQTVLDVGCGVGHAIQYFKEKGHEIWGVDGDPEAARISECPDDIAIADFRSPVSFPVADLVICTETAEHIEEQYADMIVASVVASVANLLVWSAAQPGQEWPGHVNLQPTSYWQSKLYAAGLLWDRPRTERLRTLMVANHAQHEYSATNFIVMRRP